MRLAIFGLGQVGLVSAACLCELGHEVRGVDVHGEKVRQVNAGRSPLAEAAVGELISRATRKGRLRATQDAADAVAWAQASLVCVGTPTGADGRQDTSQVRQVVQIIGEALRDGADRHTVVVRSTLLPGNTLGLLAPILERASGKRCGQDLGLSYSPEFLRAGTAVRDFMQPPYTIVGGFDAESAATTEAMFREVDAPVHVVPVPDAEMLKYAANSFHALKVTFANEIGSLSKSVGADGHHVMRLLAQDSKLNTSPAYLKPGFAYGGPCLSKDLRALLDAAQRRDVDLPLLQSVEESNALHIERAIGLVLSQPGEKIGVLGLTFKAGTQELRASPVASLVEALIRDGRHPRVYDPGLNAAMRRGAHRGTSDPILSGLSRLAVPDAREVLDHADVLVIGNGNPEFAELLAQPRKKTVVDLAGLFAGRKDWKERMAGRYFCLSA